MATNSANFLRYGPIKLNIVKLQEFKRESIYADREKTHYIYTRHTLVVSATVFPDSDIDYNLLENQGITKNGTCFNLQVNEPAGENMFPQQAAQRGGLQNKNNVRVDALVRYFLTIPRQKLKYVVGNSVLIESPAPDLMVDCNNGPKPVACTVKSVNGLQSLFVEFAIQTDINDSTKFGAPKYPILSNHFSMEHDIDQDYYTTRKISGVAVFRSDLMHKDGLSPDDFREWLNLPSPYGFKRDVVRCRLHPDSMKMEYSFIDRELHYHLDTRPNLGKINVNGKSVPPPNMRNITRLEIQQGMTMQQETIVSAFTNAMNSKENGNAAEKSPTSIAGLAWKGVKNISAAIAPFKKDYLNITVYGNNLSEKHELEYLCLFLIEKRLPFKSLSGTYTFQIIEDVLGSFVKVHVTRMSSIFDVAGAAINDVVGNNLSLNATILSPQPFLGSFANTVKNFMNTEGKFDLESMKNKSFFDPEQDIEGVAFKTYKAGTFNTKFKDAPRIKVRDGEFNQMRGSYLEQLFVEGVRHSPDEPPIDDHTFRPFEYPFNPDLKDKNNSNIEQFLPSNNFDAPKQE